MNITTIKIACSALLVMNLTISCIGSKGNKEQTKSTLTSFPIPTPPSMMTNPDDQAKYITTNYWSKFDFTDTTLISNKEVTEQGFSNFINMLSYVKPDVANIAINTMLSKAQAGDSVMFDHFLELSDKYLYNGNSPLMNEELYIVILNYIISSPDISEINKLRPKHLLSIAMKNRVGEVANDFKYNLKSGTTATLYGLKSTYTLLFFNNPECADCARVKSYISSSDALSSLQKTSGREKTLAVLSIYPDKSLDAWRGEVYPEGWINGVNLDQSLNSEKLYDLKAIPTLYLLDSKKRVILKDAPVERIEAWLVQNTKQP